MNEERVVELRDATIMPPSRRRNQSAPPLLRDVELTVHRGESLAIVGRSGSGKSTLLYVLGLLLPLTAGSYQLCGENMRGVNRTALARARGAMLGFVFQDAGLLGELNVQENVALPLGYQPQIERGHSRRIAAEALTSVGLAGTGERAVPSLSGGEQQRVAIARALVHNPRLILADEPTGSLDGHTAHTIMELLLSRTSETATSLVVVTHDPAVALRMDRCVAISDGRLVPASHSVIREMML